MIIYGRNAVREALRAGRRPIHEVWATRRAAESSWLNAARDVHVVDGAEVERRAGSEDHQGVCARTEGYPYVHADDILGRPDPLIVALDELQDVQNLGAICRTAEAAGADGVVICERRAAEVTPAVCKASAGAVEHLRIAHVTNLADFLLRAKDRNCWCYGAAAGSPTSYAQVDWKGGAVIVLGAEGRGLRPRVEKTCDQLVSLPLQGRIESLNVSATAAVLLYAALQARMHS